MHRLEPGEWASFVHTVDFSGTPESASLTLIGSKIELHEGDQLSIPDGGPVAGRWVVADAHNPERVVCRKPVMEDEIL
jgi:hypothetical protein